MKSDFRKLLFYSRLVTADMKFISQANLIKCTKLTVEMKHTDRHNIYIMHSFYALSHTAHLLKQCGNYMLPRFNIIKNLDFAQGVHLEGRRVSQSSTLKLEATCCPEMLVLLYQITQLHLAEDCNLTTKLILYVGSERNLAAYR
jgi:hypothetical protein